MKDVPNWFWFAVVVVCFLMVMSVSLPLPTSFTDRAMLRISGQAPVGAAAQQAAESQIANQQSSCIDGTLNNQCSVYKPKACLNGVLANYCQGCGCPSGLLCQNDGTCAANG